ncbi:MAG: hypothetical protein K9H25_22320 [Rhodospirillum sp.]|nr:hypothetical protein [Rhodospirillum sp.]MCF8491854.1 hypothetical protein [Rhodospirillum sp.]MCF8501145.1 hypothetical protein [Rhodospirillum sp.]
MTPWKDIISRRLAFKPDSESEGRRNDDLSDPAGLGAHEPSSAEERWLGSYLRRAYDDVVAEPLPNSFDDLLRRLQDDDGEAKAASSVSASTDSQ